MISSLYYAPLLKDQDRIAVLDRREPVRDHKCRSSLHQLVHAVLYDLLCSRINGAGRLIQDQHWRIRDRCSRDREELSLSL